MPLQKPKGMETEFNFTFGSYLSHVLICEELPAINKITDSTALIVCDANTESIAREVTRGVENPILVLESGEKSKNWDSVQKIISFGMENGLGRDSFFVGVGGGVLSDLTAFSASLYKRGANLCIVSTSLLGIIDASFGGKTGINLIDTKNAVGTFYPAKKVFLPIAALDSLPEVEWKSGFAELIKTAILDSNEFLDLIKELFRLQKKGRNSPDYRECLKKCISMAVEYKGKIVENDPRETLNKRVILNLGHTFAHALEAAAGFGAISHGEAVAWGMVRACELGVFLGITPLPRAKEIAGLLSDCGYEIRAPFPTISSCDKLIKAIMADKKHTIGGLRFIIPRAEGAQIVSAENTPLLGDGEIENFLRSILNGNYSF